MKKIFTFLLAVMLMLSITACNGDGNTADNKNTDTAAKTDEVTEGDETEKQGESTVASEKCAFCYDLETPSDRKCDNCGSWINPDGEAWTAQVPVNLKVIVEDSSFCYAVEKIGEEFYVKMWSDKAEMEKEEVPYEDFARLTERYNRYKKNTAQTEWTKGAVQTKYADVYELFAIEVLRNLNGSAVSKTVEECKTVEPSGTEAVAGKECVIKEYSSVFGTQYKVWLWNDMPMKKMYKDTDDTDFNLMWEIYEWNTEIAAFSSDMPE